MINRLLFKSTVKENKAKERGVEYLGIIWWADPCETKTLGKVESYNDLPIYKTRGTIIDMGKYYRIIKEEQLDPEASSDGSEPGKDNQISNIPKSLVRQKILVKVTEDQIEICE